MYVVPKHSDILADTYRVILGDMFPHQMVVLLVFLLVAVGYAVQVGEVAVQIYTSTIGTA